MAKQITVTCSREIAGVLVDALRWFVACNYPHGADECSIAAREALLGLAAHFEQELIATGQCSYSSRVRAFVCEAVNGYTGHLARENGQSYTHRCALMIAVCRGTSDGQDFAAATRLDEQAEPGPNG